MLLSRFVFFRKNRVIAGLVILVIGMASVLTSVEALAWFHYEEYGSVQYGCNTLAGSKASNPSTVNVTDVRWMLFECPGGSAAYVTPGPLTCFFCAHEPNYASITPHFTPPAGVLGIFAVSDPQWDCPGQNPTTLHIPLVSGWSQPYVDRNIDYCVVLNSSVKSISPFSIEWSAGPLQGSALPSVGVSAPNASTPQGQNVTTTLSLSSQNGFAGKVTLSGYMIQRFLNQTYYPQILFKSDSLTLKPGGQNSTTVTIRLFGTYTPATYWVQFSAGPIFNLSSYGDYAGSATRLGGSTDMQLTIS